MKSTYKRMSKYILLFMCIFYLVGCSSSSKQIEKELDSPPDNERLITIDGVDIKVDEVMPYLLQVKMEFEELGGEDVWDHNDFSGGKRAEDVAKIGVLDNLTRTKILVKKSSEIGIGMTETEEDEVRAQALNYYNDLNKADIENYHLTKESIFNSFKEYRLANKVISETTKEYVPGEDELMDMLMTNKNYAELKIADPEEILRKLKVRHIFIKTHEKNEKDEYTLISENILEEAKVLAEKVYQKAVDGENYIHLVKEYSEDEASKEKEGKHIFLVRRIKDEFKSLIDLEPGDISDILKSDYGYHLFKVEEKIDPTEEEITSYVEKFGIWEQQLKEQYTEQLKNIAFDEIYKEWENNTSVELNEELWENIDIFGNINQD